MSRERASAGDCRQGGDCSLKIFQYKVICACAKSELVLMLTYDVQLYPHFLSSLASTDTKKTVGEQSNSSPPAVEDMTEGSVDLALLSVQMTVRHHLGENISAL